MAGSSTLDQIRHRHRRQVITPGIIIVLATLAVLFVFGGLSLSPTLYSRLYFHWVLAAAILTVLLVVAVTRTKLRAVWAAIGTLVLAQTVYALVRYSALTTNGVLVPDLAGLFAFLLLIDGSLVVIGLMVQGMVMVAERLIEAFEAYLVPIQAQAQAIQSRFDSIFQHTANAIVVIDSNGHVSHANPGFERLTRYRRETVSAWTVETLVSRLVQIAPSDLEGYQRQVVEQKVALNLALDLLRADGSSCPVEANVIPLSEPDCILISIRDVSALQAAKSESHLWLAELAGINEITTAVNQSLHLEEVLNTATTALSLVSGMEIVAIQTRDSQTGDLKPPSVKLNFSNVLTKALGQPDDLSGILGQVYREGERFVVESVPASDDPAVRSLSETEVNALMCVPLLAGTETVGVVTLASRRPQHFSGRLLAVLSNAIREIGTAVRNADLYESERRQRTVAESLRCFSEEVSRSLNRQDIFYTMAHQFCNLSDAEKCILFLLDSDRDELDMAAMAGDVGSLNHQRFSCKEFPSWQMFVEGRRFFIGGVENIADDFVLPACIVEALDLPTSVLVVPLRDGENFIGLVVVANKQGDRFTQQDAAQLEMMTSSVSIAIRNAELFEQLSAMLDTLEMRVEERTAALSEALARAEEADQFKLHLLAMVSHELRTPLGAIKGYTTTLLDYADRLSQEKQMKLLGIIDRATDHLTHLIKDLIDLSRIEAGRLRVMKEPTNLARIITRVRHDINSVAPQRRIEINIADDVPKRILVDPERFQQIVANLLSNADKYTPEDMLIRVQVSRDDGYVLIQVEDQGPGIPQEHKEKIFEHFYRISRPDDWNQHGVGLGLAICKGLVDEHGGRIWVDNLPQGGARFSFTLPLDPDEVEDIV